MKTGAFLTGAGCIMLLLIFMNSIYIALKKCMFSVHCLLIQKFAWQKKNSLQLYFFWIFAIERRYVIVKAAKNIFAEFDIALYTKYTHFWLCIYTTILIRYFDLQLHERIWWLGENELRWLYPVFFPVMENWQCKLENWCSWSHRSINFILIGISIIPYTLKISVYRHLIAVLFPLTIGKLHVR